MIKFYGDMGAAQGISTLSDMVDALDFWQDNTIVNPGDIARSSTNSMIYAVAQTKGSTGTVEPVWGNTAGVTLIDNAVTWLVKDIRIADGAAKADKLTTASKINGIPFDGSQDITLPTDTIDGASYIGSGLKVSSFDGLNVNIGSGKAKIAGNGINFPGGKLTLNPRKASLMYLDSTGTLGKVDCANPIDFVDDNTVGMWVFNQTVAGANIPNSAVGKSAIAVANDLVQHGGIASVDGWFDNSLKLDGTTGYFDSSNITNFPIGAAEREINLLLTVNKINPSPAMYVFDYGSSGAIGTNSITIDTNGAVNIILNGSSISTGYVVSAGQTLLISLLYSGAYVSVYINGNPVYPATAITVNTTATQVMRIGVAYDMTDYSYITLHYLEVRNKMRSPASIGAMANKLVLPVFYDKTTAIYPTIPAAYAATSHEYGFNDAGSSIADSNTTVSLNGTASGTASVDSELGLGKARRFNGSSDKITLPSATLSYPMTVFGVVNLASSANQTIIDQRLSGTVGWMIEIIGQKIGLSSGNSNFYSNSQLVLGKPAFFAITAYSPTDVRIYLDKFPDAIGTVSGLNAATSAAVIGFNGLGNSNYFNGIMEELAYIPAALTQAEIAQVYNALMVTGRRNIIDDVIPANAISLGFIRTNSAKVIEKNDSWYKFGRREGATGGNRKVFLPWKYFSGATMFQWDNPFGTGKYRKDIHWAQDAKGTNELPVVSRFYTSASYGVSTNIEGGIGRNDAQNVVCHALGAPVYFNGAWQSSGYIGVYIEVMEDYKGADAV